MRVNVADLVVLGLRYAKVPRRLTNQIRAILFRLLPQQELCSVAEVFLPLVDEVVHLQPVLQLIAKLPLLLETLVGLRELAAIRVGRKPPLQHILELRRVTAALPIHLPKLVHAAPHGHDGVAHDVEELGVLRERRRNFPRACAVGRALVQPLVAEPANRREELLVLGDALLGFKITAAAKVGPIYLTGPALASLLEGVKP